jgi:Tol biopolymer transport system component
MRVDGGSVAQVIATQTYAGPAPPELFSPAWAPDGSYIAFVMNGDLYASRGDGSPPQRITEIGGIYAPACITWARNGVIAFRVPAMHTFRIMTVRSDGSNLEQVGWGLCPALSPSGDRIVTRNGGDLEIMNSDGSGLRPLTSGRSFVRPFWSPDGTRILTAGTNSDNPYDSDIFVVDAASGAVSQLTTDPNLDALPAWSPDGNFITFASKRTLRYGVYIMRADGTDQHMLATPQESAAPQWATR